MKTPTSSKLICISGIIIFTLSTISLLTWLYLYNLMTSVTTPPEFIQPLLDAFIQNLRNPFLIIWRILAIVIGIILIISARKLKKSKNISTWSIVALTLGILILVDLNTTNSTIGIKTAGVLSVIGGIFGLIESNKK